jgi:RNA polymerase sigma-70 factor (sigma-E family)
LGVSDPIIARDGVSLVSAGVVTVVDFDAYVAAHAVGLLRRARLLTGDHQKAEDLVQTALAKTWPHWQRVSQGGQVDAYVRRVMVTTYLSWWRRRWNVERPTEVLPDVDPRESHESAVARHADLMVALASLPKGQRAAVVLRYLEDLTEAQTAEALGCSVGTVKSQVARALRTLQSCPSLAAQEVPGA